jgi:hypothetical protein
LVVSLGCFWRLAKVYSNSCNPECRC